MYGFNLMDLSWMEYLQNGPQPSPRASHSATVFPVAPGKMFVFAGKNGSHFFNDTYLYDFEDQEWEIVQIAGSVLPRAFHTVDIYDSKSIVILGGFNEGGFLDDRFFLEFDVWEVERLEFLGSESVMGGYHLNNQMLLFNGNNMSLCNVNHNCNEFSLPVPSWMGLTVNVWSNKAYFFAGRDATTVFDDLYVFDGDDVHRVELKGGPKRYFHSGVITKGFLYVFGGRSADLSLTNDVYSLNIEAI